MHELVGEYRDANVVTARAGSIYGPAVLEYIGTLAQWRRYFRIIDSQLSTAVEVWCEHR